MEAWELFFPDSTENILRHFYFNRTAVFGQNPGGWGCRTTWLKGVSTGTAFTTSVSQDTDPRATPIPSTLRKLGTHLLNQLEPCPTGRFFLAKLFLS